MRLWVYILAIAFIHAAALRSVVAEDFADHRPSESVEATPSNPKAFTPGPSRRDLLISGIEKANLTPPALRVLDRVLRQNPSADSAQFNNLITRIGSQNRDLFQPEQVEDLKRLYSETLSGIEGEPALELADAAKQVLQSEQPIDRSANLEAEDGDTKEKAVGAQARGGAAPGPLTPEAVDGLLQNLNGNLAAGLPGQAGLLGADGLIDRDALLLNQLLGKGKGEEASGRGDRSDFRPPSPPPGQNGLGFNNERDRDDREGRKNDDSKHLLEALAKNNGNRGAVNIQAPSAPSGGQDKQQETKQAAASPADSGSRRRRSEPEADEKPPTKEESPSLAGANDLLSQAKQPPGPPPKKSPLSPVAAGPASGGGVAGGGAAGGFGGGMGGMMGGMGGMGGMMGGMGGMMGGMGMGGGLGSFGGGGSGAFDGADPFGGVGGGGDGGYGPGMGMGSSFAKSVGYGSGGGSFGGGGGGSVDAGGTEYEPPAGVPEGPGRLPSLEQQLGRSAASGEPSLFLLKDYVGFTGNRLCDMPDATKRIGICIEWEARRRKAAAMGVQ